MIIWLPTPHRIARRVAMQQGLRGCPPCSLPGQRHKRERGGTRGVGERLWTCGRPRRRAYASSTLTRSLSAVVSREKDRDPPAGKGLRGEIARSGQLPGWWIRSDASTAMIFSDDVLQISAMGAISEQSTRKLPSPLLLLRLTPAFRKNVVSVSESASVSQESTAAPEPLSAVTMYRVHFQSKSPSAVSGSLVMASMAGTSRIPFASTL